MEHTNGTGIAINMDYPVFSENGGVKRDLSVFQTEYRILQKMKRMVAEFSATGKCSCHFMMRELLTAANGATAYDFPLEILLNHAKDYCNVPQAPLFLPMTIIVWKNFSGCILCSVERIFLKWDGRLTLEENLFLNVFMEHSSQITSKLLQQNYDPVGIIGKGDFIRSLREVFGEQLGFTVI
jgi:hypothetical protein